MTQAKLDLERDIRSLDERIAKASPVVARVLKIHRDAAAKALEKYLPDYDHEGPKMRIKRAKPTVETL